MTAGGRARIFVIDDDPAMRHSICLLLDALGWEGRGFGDGEGYLATVETEAPDCVLLDLHLPGLNYPQILERSRALGVRAPVIGITGDAEDSPAAIDALRQGAVEVLGKPMGEAVLSATIARYLGPPPRG